MGIVQSAINSVRSISGTRELLERQLEMLKIIYEHRAISEAEYLRSRDLLLSRLLKI